MLFYLKNNIELFFCGILFGYAGGMLTKEIIKFFNNDMPWINYKKIVSDWIEKYATFDELIELENKIGDILDKEEEKNTKIKYGNK